MVGRALTVAILAAGISGMAVMAQEKAPGTAPTGIGAAVEKEVKGLTAEDFPEREAALKRLQALIAAQVKQRAEIQAVLNDLQADLAKQERALAVVTDAEAQAQVAGLLEMERGVSGWTIKTMSEPLEKRKALLAWGLSKESAAVLARAYSGKVQVRLAAVKELAKMTDDGAGWTLSRLINDPETPVRAATMAACWDRKASADVVDALWFRAVTGPLASAENNNRFMIEQVHSDETFKVEFPGGEPLEFDNADEAALFEDALLAGDVLVHTDSPLVKERVVALVQARIKAGKTLFLSEDPDWTLVTHRLVETYGIKEAIPLLAEEALSMRSDEMGGEANGRPYVWSHRTMAIGTLCKLLGRDAEEMKLMRVRASDDPRGWIWATDIRPGNGGMADGTAVQAFFDWWKVHHAEYGVKEEPSAAGLPRPGRGGRGRGGGGAPAVDVPAQLPVGGGGEPQGLPANVPSQEPAVLPIAR